MTVLHVGIDDTATATQKSEGWAFILLPEEGVLKLQQRAALISATPLRASKSDRRNISKYEQFLTAIRDVIASNQPRLLAHVFDDPAWHTGLSQISEALIQIAGGALKESRIHLDSRVEAALRHVVPPLMSLQRITANRNLREKSVEVWLDESHKTRNFYSMKAGTRPSIGATGIAKSIFNTYRETNFPSSPDMAPDGLHVVKDDSSVLIQAADVFGLSSTWCGSLRGCKSR